MTFQLSFLGEGGQSTQRHYSQHRTRIRGFEGRSTQVLLASFNWRTLSRTVSSSLRGRVHAAITCHAKGSAKVDPGVGPVFITT